MHFINNKFKFVHLYIGKDPMTKVALIDMDNTVADYIGKLTEDLRAIAGPDEVVPDNIREAEEALPWFARRMGLRFRHQPTWSLIRSMGHDKFQKQESG